MRRWCRRLRQRRPTTPALAAPNLAAEAFRAGLVDECHLFLTPNNPWGGKRALPEGVRLKPELVEERRLGMGRSIFATAQPLKKRPVSMRDF
jgi:dihydrofolate reductase